jgi:mRNA interferase RelE/StbE
MVMTARRLLCGAGLEKIPESCNIKNMDVLLHNAAGKYLTRINEPMKSRIIAALRDLSKEPPRGDIKSMSGQPGNFRLRVGNYRVLYRIENNKIFVTHIAPRGEAYKKK